MVGPHDGYLCRMEGNEDFGMFLYGDTIDNLANVETIGGENDSFRVVGYNFTTEQIGSLTESRTCTDVEVEYDNIKQVDYNKVFGNWIKIYYDGNGDDSENYSIMGVGGDFTLENNIPSDGAKYIFVFSDNRTQEMIVGQTYEDYGFTDAPFKGVWKGTSAGSNSHVVKPSNSSHNVRVHYENETYYISVVWK